MHDYDFGKYYRRSDKPAANPAAANIHLNKLYRKISVALAAGLVLFFAGLMTGINFQSKKVVSTVSKVDEKGSETANDNSGVVNTADINPDHSALAADKSSVQSPRVIREKGEADSENAAQTIKKTLLDPENEYIILAKKYGDESKDRALYYAGVLNKITKDYNFEVVPSIRGKSIKLYVGPMKGKKMAEKMLARVKSIPEFANSAILYKK